MSFLSESNRALLKKLANIVGAALMLFCLYLIAIKVKGSHAQLSELGIIKWHVFALVCVFSFIHLGALTMLGCAWHGNLVQLNQPVKRLVALIIYGKTQIAKYLPGNVFHFAGRQWLARHYQLEQKKVLTATIYEILGHLFSVFCLILLSLCLVPSLLATFLSNDTLPFYHHLHSLNLPSSVVVLAIALILLFVLLLVRGKMYLDKAIVSWLVNAFKNLFTRNTFFYLGFHFVSAVLMVFVFSLLGAVDKSGAIMIMVAYWVSWLLGYVVPGAPGGLGVREMVFLLLLNHHFPEWQILTAAVTNRLFTTLGDFLFFLQAMWLERKFSLPAMEIA